MLEAQCRGSASAEDAKAQEESYANGISRARKIIELLGCPHMQSGPEDCNEKEFKDVLRCADPQGRAFLVHPLGTVLETLEDIAFGTLSRQVDGPSSTQRSVTWLNVSAMLCNVLLWVCEAKWNVKPSSTTSSRRSLETRPEPVIYKIG